MKLTFSTICLIFLFTSCNREEKYLGRLPVKNNSDLYFDLYQEQKFDNAVAIHYSIIDKNKGTLLGPVFLTGTSDFDREDTKDFTAGVYNGIIYLTFLDSNKVYAIYDTKTNHYIDIRNLTTRDTLLEIDLKKYNSRLKMSWHD